MVKLKVHYASLACAIDPLNLYLFVNFNQATMNKFKILLVCLVIIATQTILVAQPYCDRMGISNGWMLNMDEIEVDQITSACALTQALYFRADFAWSDVQWADSLTWDWSNIDRIVNSATQENLELIAIVDYFPSWADTETDTSYWYNFVYNAGLRYIPQGVVVWELWNEPNISRFWPNPNVKDYVELVMKPGSNAIRAAAESLGVEITVLSGGLAPAATDGTNISQIDFLAGIYNNGGKDYIDGVGQHPYCWPLDPSIPNTYNWFLNTQQLRDIMLSNGDVDKRIWGTEFGWPTHDPTDNGISEALQAEYLASAYKIWEEWDWTGPLIWYAYNNAGSDFYNPEDNFGLVDEMFNPKPALDTFQLIANQCLVSTSISDLLMEDKGVKVFPNPVSDRFSILDIDVDSYVQIFDMKGVLFKEAFVRSRVKTDVDVQSLPAGFYFILITNVGTGKKYYYKILKT